MKLEFGIDSLNRISRQRNLFLMLTLFLAVSTAVLSIKIFTNEERIVMVPPLTSEVTISNKKVSSSYLEQMSMTFLNSLLDLSARDVLHKRDIILKYTSNSNPGFTKKLNEYFAQSAEKYEKFDLVTYFTVKNMEIDESKNEVIAHGILNSRYGKHGFESQDKSYRLSFDFSGGYLRLKEFDQVKEEGEKE